ncbi:chromosome segregation protein SMC [Secundilactobacillus kimchicus]|uniref:chromosome segregation protein SMC n=1 Tax=Secundilactobacillus kimchicus TaxID=528209 RepID=UPI001C030BE6|nr:chromosome segregation protein SMC [Secundilactobacillus kimchicus]MBT9672843.1 chromosome segregation protein SMC [Secundilactobacillus kimchicus]
MKLKSLEISGFKSFADYTKIEFEDGVTGIVGPNGSGKSNVTEAIKWVLGEQSAKNLRGAKMPDVIFAGTSKRRPLNRAMVTMILDNSDHYVESDYTEVSVTRKLFRNGDSRYELNGQECRLKDITDLFSDSGIGGNAFSMISQGRVEAIFNSKPEDRRFIIEEVTGVSKYKSDKEKAKRELEQTAGYLNRVNDLVVELEAQLEPLAQESSLATDYVAQKRDFDQLDQTRLVLQIQDQKKALKTGQETLAAKQAQIDRSKAALADHHQALTELKERQANLQTQKDELQNQLLDLTKRHQELVGQQALTQERQNHRQETIANLTDRVKTVSNQRDGLTKQLAQCQATLKKEQQALTTAKERVKQLAQQLAALDTTAVSKEIDHLQDDYIKAMQDLTSVHNQKAYLQKNQHRADSESDRANEQLQALKQELATQTAKLQECQQLVDQAQTALETAKMRQTAAQTNRQLRQQKANQLNQQWLKALEVSQRAKARAKSLEEVAENYAGFYQGTRAVLKARNQLNGIIGPVAELLQVDSRYTKAVEAAIGSQQQNVVVETENAGKAAIQYLNQNRLGRSTFLPLTTIRAKSVDRQTQNLVSQLPGFLGVGSTLVTIAGDARMRILGDYLLGNVLFIDTLDHAVAIGKQLRQRYRMITLDGDIISATGAMTGGRSKRDSAGLLTQQQELSTLKTSIKQMDDQLTEKKRALDQLRQDDDQAALDRLNQALTTASTTYQKRLNQSELIEQTINTLKRQIKAQTTQQALQGDEEDFQQALADNERAEGELNAQVAQMTAAMTAAKAQLTENQTKSGSVSVALQTEKETVAAKRVSVGQLQRDVTEAQTQIQVADDQLSDFKNQLQDLTATTTNTSASATSSKQQLAVLADKQHEVESAIQQNQAALADQAAKISELERTVQLATETYNIEQNEKQQAEFAQSRLTIKLDQSLTTLSEQYHVSLELAVQQAVDLPLATIQQRLKLLRRGLEDIGDVNVGSIETYKQVKERYDFLTQQQADLNEAKQKLLTTMAEMDQEVITRFEKAFNLVNAQFQKTFKQMFGGGRGRLELTDPEHLLTSGIEIMAEPPGKRLQSMRLLSGGERALTAITLLFAIIQVQPVPYCVLDEAEAALDPANTARFASYLNRFQDDTQFIVITHRKETMVQTDRLYGITMQESGISKLVAVDLTKTAEIN